MGPRSILLALVVVLAGCGRPAEIETGAGADRVPRVRAVTLAPETWNETIRTYGVFEAAEEVNLSVDFSATVRRVRFREGGRVSAGEPLLELDRGERQLLLDRAAQTVEQIQAQLDRARGTLRRAEDLFVADSISRQEYEQARAEMRSLAARYGEAVAARRMAQRDLGETTLASPVTGRVVRRRVEPGETVLPGQVLGVVQTADVLRVVTFVTEREVNALRIGGPAKVTTPGVRGRVYPARVASVAAQAETATGNFAVKLTVSNDDGLLRAGMTARVELEDLSFDQVLLIPAAATVDRDRRRVVYVVEGGTAREVEPVLAATLEDRLPVLAGLEAGDVLITSGLEDLVDGSRVEIAPPPPAEDDGVDDGGVDDGGVDDGGAEGGSAEDGGAEGGSAEVGSAEGGRARP